MAVPTHCAMQFAPTLAAAVQSWCLRLTLQLTQKMEVAVTHLRSGWQRDTLRVRSSSPGAAAARPQAPPCAAGARRVLIANRGEIARRVSRSCHALGLVPVVVFTEADALSLHVLESEHAVCLGADKRAYTSIDTMVGVAVEHGCAACARARLLRAPRERLPSTPLRRPAVLCVAVCSTERCMSRRALSLVAGSQEGAAKAVRGSGRGAPSARRSQARGAWRQSLPAARARAGAARCPRGTAS